MANMANQWLMWLLLCSAEERNSNSFGTTWGWVCDDKMLLFGWTIHLRSYS